MTSGVIWLVLIGLRFCYAFTTYAFQHTLGKLSVAPPVYTIKHTIVPRHSFLLHSTSSVATQPTVNEHIASFPWQSSLSPSRSLCYMPLLETQLQLIQEMGMEEVKVADDFMFKQSSSRPARIHSKCFRNDQFRKVRMTYFDGGDALQVFNTLWYPAYEYDLPLLGVDMISLGRARVMTVVDFQPLHPSPEYSARYIDHLSEVRRRYPALHHQLSGKIYDDPQFFSRQMLFGRFNNESLVDSVVLPSFKEYLGEYVEQMARATPDRRPTSMRTVRERQTAYDAYGALKDPAASIFDAYFGKDWSHPFVHEFLFSLSGESGSDGSVNGESCDTSNSNSCIDGQRPVHNFQIDEITGEVKLSTSSHGG